MGLGEALRRLFEGEPEWIAEVSRFDRSVSGLTVAELRGVYESYWEVLRELEKEAKRLRKARQRLEDLNLWGRGPSRLGLGEARLDDNVTELCAKASAHIDYTAYAMYRGLAAQGEKPVKPAPEWVAALRRDYEARRD